MSQTPIRVLFFAEGATLAHVARPFVLADALSTAGFDLRFARPPAFDWLTRGAAFSVLDLACQPAETFARRLARGEPLYDLATLEAYVAADLALIRELRPDIVIGDFRLSLSVSARLARVPYATICDAYWSPEAPAEAPPLPVLPFTRFMPIPLAEALFRAVSPLAFRLHARPMEALRRAHGLPGFDHDLRRCYTDADLRLFANPAALFPAVRPHAGAAFIGPIAWSPPGRLPDDFPDEGDLIYVSMGSSGNIKVLSALFDALSRQDRPVVVTTAGRPVPPPPAGSRIRLYDFLPGRDAIARARLVVCNGGSPTTNQALAAGVPVLGIPTNMDQFLNMRAIQTAGCGLTVRADRASPERLRSAIEALLPPTAPYRANAQALQADPAPTGAGPAADALATLLATRLRTLLLPEGRNA
ncbi:nucleotide disphospho-sugar-binding domain-containing protein [Rhodocyclaceae bacterium SMB388]